MSKDFSLTSPQFDIYLDQLVYPASSVYSIATAVFIDVNIDEALFKKCLQILFDQNDALRLELCGSKDAPRQKLSSSGDVKLHCIDLSAYQEQQELILEWIYNEVEKTIDMFSGPLYRFFLIKISADRYCWLHKYHHLIADGWSTYLYIRQVMGIYFQRSLPVRFSGHDRVSYISFLDKDRNYLSSSRYQRDMDYWLSKGYWQAPPALVRQPLHDKSQRCSGQLRFHLDAGLKTQLLDLASQENSSLQRIWIVALYLYFFRVQEVDSFILGLSLANRANNSEKMIGGMFATTIPFSIKIDPDSTVQNLLKQTSQVLSRDYKHRCFPVTQLAKLLGKHHNSAASLYQVAFTYHNYEYEDLDVDGIIQPMLLQSRSKQLPLSVWVIDSSTTAQPEVVIDFNEKYFSHTQALIFKKVLLHILAALADFIQIPVSQFPLVSDKERHYLLKELHNNIYQRPDDKTIKDLISAQFLKVPENVGFIYQEHLLNYRSLALKVNYLAVLLQENGVVRGSIVPVLMKQGLEAPISLLAILQCGAAFFILDPKWPELRIKHLLAELAYPVMVTNADVIALQFSNKKIISLAYESMPDRQEYINVPNLPDDLIYCFSTSGSTGHPKIAKNIHRGILNRMLYMHRVFGEGPGHRILQTSGLNFDSSLWQILWPLCNGATVVIPDDSQRLNIRQLLQLVRHNAITMMDLVPSFFIVLVEHLKNSMVGGRYLETLQFLFIGGEEMDIQVVNQFRQLCPWVKVFNTYGPTETSIGVIFHEVDNHDNHSVPLGRPIDNVYALILDAYRSLCPVGVPGELYLSGECVGGGYLNNSVATQAAFIENPFAEIPYPVLYKTGDRVSYREDGNIDFLGRVDEQLKINGIRIEPKEVALTIEQLPSVKKAVVIAQVLSSGRKVLVAYVQPCDNTEIRENEIIAFAKGRLPLSMIPEAIEIVSHFPLMATGKLDKSSLPALNLTIQQCPTIPARSPQEKVLMEIWQNVLERPVESMNSDFFDLGGNSLLFVSLIAQVENHFKIQLPYIELSEMLTLASMNEKITAQINLASMTNGPSETYLNPPLGFEQLDPELYQRLLQITAEWRGARQNPGSIMTGLNTEVKAVPLFWCLQSYYELTQLGHGLGGDRPIYGMRSGHNIMEYTEDTVQQLAKHYVKEILEIPFSGPYIIGGNCQGALIAMSVAKQLWMNDKEVALLFSMEETPKNLYHGKIAMIFGRDSIFNPYKENDNPEREWSKYYRGEITYDEISGQHGHFFNSPNIETLTAVLRRRIRELAFD